LPVGEDNSVCQTPEEAVDNTILGDMQTAPPLYENHRLDVLYNDIDPAGFQTPGFTSGAHTPFHPGSFSRNPSFENLSSLGDAAHPLALHNRLTNLQLRNEASSRGTVDRHNSAEDPSELLTQQHHHPEPGSLVRGTSYFDAGSPPSGRHPASNNGAGSLRSGGASASRLYALNANALTHHLNHNQNPNPSHLSNSLDESISAADLYDMPRLERLTSYTTAVKTPVRSAPGDVPPTYENATSRPPSPDSAAAGLQMPMRAHVARHARTGGATPLG